MFANQPLRFAHRSTSNLMTQNLENGIVNLPANRPVEEIVARFTALLHEKGIKLFALVDHSGEAKGAGMEMRPTTLLIFGNPKAGTPVMQAAPSIAIDLPLKILVWEDAEGKVWVSYNAPAYLQRRHAVPDDLLANLAAIEMLATYAAK